jgi:hypothetical protein
MLATDNAPKTPRYAFRISNCLERTNAFWSSFKGHADPITFTFEIVVRPRIVLYVQTGH